MNITMCVEKRSIRKFWALKIANICQQGMRNKDADFDIKTKPPILKCNKTADL